MAGKLSVAQTLGDKLRLLRMTHSENRGKGSLSLRRLSALTGIPVSTLSQWESGRFTPSPQALFPLAKFYQVSLDELTNPLLAVEVDADGSPVLRPASGGEPGEGELVELPNLGKARAGEVTFWKAGGPENAAAGRLSIPSEWLSPGYNHFALTVEGQSMQLLGILAGDTLVVERNPLPRRGDVVVVKTVYGDVLVKRYIDNGRQIILEPASLEHEVMILDREDAEILGVVRHVLRLRMPPSRG